MNKELRIIQSYASDFLNQGEKKARKKKKEKHMEKSREEGGKLFGTIAT